MCKKSSTFARNFVKQSSTKAYKHSFFLQYATNTL